MSLYKELHRPNKSLKFDSPNAEVSFLKSFNLKLASSPSKPRVLTIETDIFNTKSDDFLLKPNISPSLSKKNPIVQDSPVYDVFYKTCFKKSPMGNFTTMGNFDFPKKVLKNGVYNKNSKGISGETTWKPSKKRFLEQKSEEIDENKRHKAVFQENSQKYNRDPILEGEDLKQKPLRICPKNVQISEEYEKYKEKIMLLPSERTSHHPNTFENRSKDSIKPILESRNETIKANNLSQKENKTEIKATGKECKSLLCYEYALPYKKEAFSKEIGKFSIAERSFVYKDVNERDFRKKAMIFQYKD